MALATIDNVEKAYAGRPILRGISFDLQAGQRIGLVGPNGAGKTTLLKLLAGIEEPDHGSVTIAKAAKMSYVSQQPRLDPEETLRHQVSLVFEEMHEIERQMHEAADALAHHTSGPLHDAAMEKYGELEHHFQHMGGYDIQRRVETVVDQLGFRPEDLDLPIKALSGGQKSRAQLARLLLEGPDLMLLDEPTNHLDLPMLDWLEGTLNEMTDTTILVVSHDRYFLDSVVDEIFDLRDGKMQRYPGNYSAYMTLRAEREMAQQRAYEQQQAMIAKEEEYIRRFQAGQRAMQARGRKTRLNRLKNSDAMINRVKGDGKKMVLNLAVDKPSGIDALKVEGLQKSFGEKHLFRDLDINLLRGKRLGIIGPNGSGKSTLLNILAGELPPDAGEIKWGHNVNLQFYKQEHQDLEPGNNILEELQKVRVTAKQQELRDLAGMFLFSGETQEKKIGVLSGGEKARVAMAKLLLKPTNTILMDEPTNHLDMPTCEVLEGALDSYDGTLILVSHDRYFMDQVCDMLLVLQPNQYAGGGLDSKLTWKLYKGCYTEYLAAVAAEKVQAAESKKQAEKAAREAEANRKAAEQKKAQAAKAASASKAKVPLKYQKHTAEQLEKLVMEKELEVAELENSFGNPKIASNAAAMQAAQQKYNQAKKDLAELMVAWEIKAT